MPGQTLYQISVNKLGKYDDQVLEKLRGLNPRTQGSRSYSVGPETSNSRSDITSYRLTTCGRAGFECCIRRGRETMSKNFELMQQAGKEQPIRPVRQQEPISPILTGNGHGNGHRNGTRAGLNLDELAQEETLKLVQRVFLVQASEPPRTVVFAGIDHGNGCSRTCARTAEVLAANIAGKVCLVDANLRSPALPEFFGMTNHHGLTDSLLQDGPILSFAKQVGTDNLWLLSCGSLASDSASLLNLDPLEDPFGGNATRFRLHPD